MKEIVNNIIDATKDRLKNPFIGAYLISWSTWNWKILAYLFFSKETIEERLHSLPSYEYNSWQTWGVPLIITLTYLLGIPYFLWFVEWVIVESKNMRKNMESAHRENVAKNKLKQVKAETALEVAKAEYLKLDDLNKKIEALKKENTNLENIISDHESTLRSQHEEITNFKKKEKTTTTLEKKKKTPTYQDEFNQQQWKIDYKSFSKSPDIEYFKQLTTLIIDQPSLHDLDKQIVMKFKSLKLIKASSEHLGNEYQLTEKGEMYSDLLWKEHNLEIPVSSQASSSEELPF
ncbi:hypothetical protein OAH12_02080 [Cyclobacteriaceae bacterium]|nr:hypothetical protein [Cyclobacteriaceae bacterium]